MGDWRFLEGSARAQLEAQLSNLFFVAVTCWDFHIPDIAKKLFSMPDLVTKRLGRSKLSRCILSFNESFSRV